MTRKQLVEGLRVIHEADEITKIVSRAKRIDISFRSAGKDCLLVIPLTTPTQAKLAPHVRAANEAMEATGRAETYDHRNTTTTKATTTNPTNTTDNDRPESADSLRFAKSRKDNSIKSSTTQPNS